MPKIAKNIIDFCSSMAPYAYVLAVVTIFIVGVMFALPSEKAHEKAKSYGGWGILGTLFVAGCVTIGKWIAANWSF